MGRSKNRKLAAGLVQHREQPADFQHSIPDRDPEHDVDLQRSMHRFPPDPILYSSFKQPTDSGENKLWLFALTISTIASTGITAACQYSSVTTIKILRITKTHRLGPRLPGGFKAEIDKDGWRR
jgi:hypothetical protein